MQISDCGKSVDPQRGTINSPTTATIHDPCPHSHLRHPPLPSHRQCHHLLLQQQPTPMLLTMMKSSRLRLATITRQEQREGQPSPNDNDHDDADDDRQKTTIAAKSSHNTAAGSKVCGVEMVKVVLASYKSLCFGCFSASIAENEIAAVWLDVESRANIQFSADISFFSSPCSQVFLRRTSTFSPPSHVLLILLLLVLH